uniref:Tetratricopeptide repeat protein n=1 Tax=Flavobacterium columnare TaxID=996 RepID=A0AA94F595_9FLAO
MLFILNLFVGYTQTPSGYWDNQRGTTKEVNLSAGEKGVVKIQDLPVGTTEIAYRITLLDENQKMVNDLSSVLKAIPDPYFIGKGTGSAISLVSSISGVDKCTYAVFLDESSSNDFVKTESVQKACLYQKNPISKDARLISLKSTCLNENTKNLWFTFKNQNWLMSEKIILEVIPWVDNIASRGWTKKNKENVIENIKHISLSKNLKSDVSNSIAFCLLNKVMEKYRFQDFLNLSKEEQILFVEQNDPICFKQANNMSFYNNLICQQAENLFKNKREEEAINWIQNKLITTEYANALDYNFLAEMYMNTNQFEKSLQTLLLAEDKDKSELKIKLNLAHIYMFLDDISKSKEIHKKYKSQNISTKQTWTNKTINDLEKFKKTSLPQENIDRIWKLYN